MCNLLGEMDSEVQYYAINVSYLNVFKHFL
jgi:hypothetical protein